MGLPIASGTNCLTAVRRTSDTLLVDLPRDFDALPFLEEFSRSFKLDSHFSISTCLKRHPSLLGPLYHTVERFEIAHSGVETKR